MKASRLPPLLALSGGYVVFFLLYLLVWSVMSEVHVPPFPWMGIVWAVMLLSVPLCHRLIVRLRLPPPTS
jgi:hypothetical protein